MARIAGVTLPNNKRVEIGLTAVYGVGRSASRKVLDQTGVDPNIRIKDLTEIDLKKLAEAVTALRVEGDLRREVTQNVKRLQDIGTYRGTRHEKKLPLRGQRTKTNARTRRGKRVTVGSGRLKTAAKT